MTGRNTTLICNSIVLCAAPDVNVETSVAMTFRLPNGAPGTGILDTLPPSFLTPYTFLTLCCAVLCCAVLLVAAASFNFASCLAEDKLTVYGTRAAVSMSIFGPDGPALHTPNGKTTLIPVPPYLLCFCLLSAHCSFLRPVTHFVCVCSGAGCDAGSRASTARAKDCG